MPKRHLNQIYGRPSHYRISNHEEGVSARPKHSVGLLEHVPIAVFKTLNNLPGLSTTTGELSIKLLGIESKPSETQCAVFGIRNRADIRWMRDDSVDGVIGHGQSSGVPPDDMNIGPRCTDTCRVTPPSLMLRVESLEERRNGRGFFG